MSVFKKVSPTWTVSLAVDSRTPSPTGSTSDRGDSRPHTPSEDDEGSRTLTRDAQTRHRQRDSPTPDRESLKIDDMDHLTSGAQRNSGIKAQLDAVDENLKVQRAQISPVHWFQGSLRSTKIKRVLCTSLPERS